MTELECGSKRLWGRRVALAFSITVAFVLWRCPIAELFGVPCPGCGLTRALLALARGDVAGAVRLHPLSPALVPLAIGLVCRELARVGLCRAVPRRADERLALLLATLLLGVWLARFGGAFGGPVQVASHLHV